MKDLMRMEMWAGHEGPHEDEDEGGA